MIKSFHLLKTTDGPVVFDSDMVPEERLLIRDPSPLEWRVLGFAQHTIPYETYVYIGARGAVLLLVEHREKVLPGKVIKQRMRELIASLEERERRKATRKEIAQYRDQVEADLLPKAFIKSSTMPVMWIDENTFAIGTSSAKLCDDIIVLLREFTGGFAYTAVAQEGYVSKFLTPLVHDADPKLESVFAVSNAARFEGSQGVVTIKDGDLTTDVAMELIGDGAKVTQAKLAYEDEYTFTLAKNGTIRSFKFSKITLDEVEAEAQAAGGDDASLFDANFALVAGTLDQLATDLGKEVAAYKPKDEEKETPPLQRQPRDLGVNKAGEKEPWVRFWHHPESSCVLTTHGPVECKKLLDSPDGSLCVEIDEAEYKRLDAQYSMDKQLSTAEEDDEL